MDRSIVASARGAGFGSTNGEHMKREHPTVSGIPARSNRSDMAAAWAGNCDLGMIVPQPQHSTGSNTH